MSKPQTYEERLRAILRADEDLMVFLRIARSLGLPQWRLAAGSIYQTVWNHLTGQPRGTGIKDYDLIYFDDGDLSWEAEDAIIRQSEAAFAGRWPVEVRNQARVHLWFEQRFGTPYPQLRSADEAFLHYAAIVHAVGVRLEADDCLDIAAPFGLEDMFGMIVRPNPHRGLDKGLAAKAAKAKAIWPELTVISWDYPSAASSPGSA
ncbi:nucleotidyltransferase family protein [Labrys miyagiensis]|nr:nucleotidyltransferase family protein [Labrys miyagiensis]